MDDRTLNQKLSDLESRIIALEKLKKRELNALDPNLPKEEIAEMSPRTQALRITAGIDKPHYIGTMSIEAIKTEIRALESTHDYVFQDTHGRIVEKIEQEKKIWQSRYDELKRELAKSEFKN